MENDSAKLDQPVDNSVEIITDKEQIEKKMELLDRLIDWDTSLTSRKKFEEMLSSGKQLRIKFGADITAKILHIGHAVNLRAMRHLQDLGHKVVFLLGGFTTLVGDPTDKLQTRTTPGADDVERNKQEFINQIKSVIRFDNPNLIEVVDNTQWWGTPEKHGTVSLGKFFELLRTTTVTSLLARDMFRKRMADDIPIYLSEFLYPILQGYDSVEINSDITIVGSDQLFNEKMAWNFQEQSGQNKQAILCTKITPGLDGGEKQSKSIGNYVGLAHSPKEKFNRTMLLLDELVPQWFEVYTEIDIEQIEQFKKEYKDDPLAFKKRLAFYITELFHGEELAREAQEHFEKKKFMRRIPDEIPEIQIEQGCSLDQFLRKELNRKTGDIDNATASGALAIINHINEDGTFEETLIKNRFDAREVELKRGVIVRWGKNKFYKIS